MIEAGTYFDIMNAMTRAAEREIPAFPCTRAFPPCDTHSSKNLFTDLKCGIMFSVALSA